MFSTFRKIFNILQMITSNTPRSMEDIPESTPVASLTALAGLFHSHGIHEIARDSLTGTRAPPLLNKHVTSIYLNAHDSADYYDFYLVFQDDLTELSPGSGSYPSFEIDESGALTKLHGVGRLSFPGQLMIWYMAEITKWTITQVSSSENGAGRFKLDLEVAARTKAGDTLMGTPRQGDAEAELVLEGDYSDEFESWTFIKGSATTDNAIRLNFFNLLLREDAMQAGQPRTPATEKVVYAIRDTLSQIDNAWPSVPPARSQQPTT